MAQPVRQHLEKLRDAILQERQYAKELRIGDMQQVAEEKERIIQILSHYTELAPEDQEIAREIREENRRNAFLFRSTLGWIRETMEFFGRKTTTETYSHNANRVSSQVNGRLLSGKV